MPKTRAEIRAQYPVGETPDKTIAAKIEAAANRDKRIACRALHDIANELNCPPQKVGRTADLMEVRISHCQLGLFGRSNNTTTALPKGNVTQEMKVAVESVISDGKIACEDSWRLAGQLNLSRLEMGALCDALEVKVTPCQLGAF